jgi:hypothetical protein
MRNWKRWPICVLFRRDWRIACPPFVSPNASGKHIRQIARLAQLFDFEGALPVRVPTPWLPVFGINFRLDIRDASFRSEHE